MNNFWQKGQVLIEALVALSAAVVIIGVIAVVVVTALNNSESAKNQNLATQFAQQGMGIVRELSETNWTGNSESFDRKSGWWCLNENSHELTREDNMEDNIEFSSPNACRWSNGVFGRRVKIDHDSVDCPNSSKVTVVVSWNDGKCTNGNDLYCHKVSVDSCYANIKSIPAI